MNEAERTRLYRQRPEVRARDREWRREYRKTPQYRAAHAKVVRRAYYRDIEKARARVRGHYPQSVEAFTAASANRTAQARGVTGRLTAADVRALWDRQAVCVNCGRGRGLDHIVPMTQGGPNTPDNIQNLCVVCNQVKNKWPLAPGSIERPPFDGDAERCRWGHSRAANTYVAPKTGRRTCRLCMTANQRRYEARKRERMVSL